MSTTTAPGTSRAATPALRSWASLAWLHARY